MRRPLFSLLLSAVLAAGFLVAGTATALVLQVLGLIQPNLLAAYSSNMFGIVCVALIKIRHVRQFKRQLILDGQVALVESSPGPAAAQPGGTP